MSKLTTCVPKSLAAEFPNPSHWLDQFVLKRIFHNHIREERAALAFVLVRRAVAALEEWEQACEAAPGVGNPSGYFKMLRHLESCIAALWQGLEFSRRALQTKLFEKGDGSFYERLNWLYNTGRHFDPQNLPSGDLHCLWISNEGLNSRGQSVTFGELRDSLIFLASIVEQIATGSPKPG
ncbi:hypothetical protein [Stenotrophomonas acidaminiphila]|uniref:hypothetical protein n=1 Tax=Stenotrophomonas acidaminiphila TaxID=128780 RepID=UPI0020C72A19|nr:hypothetical protein [Stenotrophomonas acidaminiphila]